MKKLILFLLLILIFKTSNSQFIQYPLPIINSNPTFEETLNHLKALIPHVKSDSSDGYERAVERFENFWELRINQGGRISDYSGLLKDFATSLNSTSNSNKYSSGWRCLGPFSSQTHNIGRIMDVWVSPTNPDKILVGTRASGIWKSINGGIDWQNITDRTLPVIGIQSIAVSPINEDIIYATTGYSGSYTNNYGIGIIYSNDGGVHWNIDNPPIGYTNLIRTDLLFLSPLAFRAGTNELFIGLDQKMWKKDANINGSGWNSQPVLTLSNTIFDMKQYIHEIDFAPNNYNFGIMTTTFRNPSETLYTSDGGIGWSPMPFPSKFLIPSAFKAYTISTFIQNDNFAFILIAGNDYDINWNEAPKIGSVIKYDISGPQPTIIKEWELYFPETVEGPLTGFCVQNIDANKDVSFFGKPQDAVYRITLNSSSSTAYINLISRFRWEPADEKSHADIRGMKLVSNVLYSASDGGINKLTNLENGNKPDWVSINGYGLSITEHSGFDVSEFDKNLIVGGAIDGNSFKIKSDGNGGVISEHIGVGDQYEVALPKSKTYYDKNITTSNGSPNDPPGYYGPGTFGKLKSPFTGDSSKVDFSLKQFYFEDITNDFYAGTSDVYKINNFLGVKKDKTASDWDAISNTHEDFQFKNSSFNTKIGISAFKSIRLNDNIFSVYAIKAFSTSTEPITLVKSTFDPTFAGSSAYSTFDITPYSVIGVPSNNNMIYKSYITEILIDETNPNKIWISFGGTSETSTPSGRVYFTNNGGTTWTDISVGLPALPVLSMVYWKGTDDVIFAGTDVGVYVYNKANNHWEGFNNDLPFVCVPKLAINYCSNTLRACTFGRGFWETPLPSLEFENQVPIEVTSNQTWNTSRDTYQSVLVKNGATLTIEGIHDNNTNSNSVEIRIPKDKQIMVEPGGKLVISGATLTNHCDLWQGIQVYGQKTGLQTGDFQGWVVIKDGAIIENARTGVSTSKVYDWGWDHNTTGGIVHCYNSTFRNNRRDIELLSYHRTSTKKTDELANRSLFSKCLFVTTNDYLFGSQKPVHISMWDVNGASIIGSTFEDARTFPSGSIGIYTIASGFNVNEYCSGSTKVPVSSSPACSGIQSQFKNLEYGIYSINASNPKYSVNVSNSKFDKCNRAIYLNGIDYASLFLNTINVKRHSEMVVDQYSSNRYGIYLDLCKSYKVEQNILVGDLGTETQTESFGIVVRNMHGENVNINGNAFDKLSVGIEALGRNRSQTFDKGLQIKCNTFANSKYDILVLNDPETPVASGICGIARNQGYPNPNDVNQLAGNLFGNTSPSLKSNYVNQGALIDYYHHNPSSESRVVPSLYESNSKIILRGQNIAYSSATSCPSSFTNQFSSSQLRSYVITQQETVEENIAALALMIDAGNTEQFILDLDLNNTENVNTNYFLLMNVAPYLSHEVLLRVAGDGTALTNAMIRNVLVACSQAAKDEEVQLRLDNRASPLPQYMRDQIKEGILELSDMENEEREIGTYIAEINQSVNETMWRATQDTLDLTSDVIEIFNEINDYTLKMQLVNWIDADGRKNDANSLLTEIGNNLQTEEDIESYNIYNDMRNYQYEIQDQELEADKLDQNNINFLLGYLSYPDANISYAMALLKLNNQLDYLEPVLLPQENASRVVNLTPNKVITELDPSESSLEVSPNPVSDLFTAKYKILEKSSNLQLVITDINGKELFNQWLKNNIDEIIVNCNQFVSGNYIVTIKGNDIKSLSQKIVVSKK